jgi:hypothetical protein
MVSVTDHRREIGQQEIKELKALGTEDGLMVPAKFKSFIPNFQALEIRNVKSLTDFEYYYNPSFFGSDTQVWY